MGNCQVVDAAALIIQHPCGKMERFYWPLPVSEVMRINPGHYVSLVIPSSSSSSSDDHDDKAAVRVKLLRPADTLSLGHAYRLVTTAEVMEVLKAKKHAAKSKARHHHLGSNDQQAGNQTLTHHSQVTKHERRRQTANTAAVSSKSWRPSLQSISESGS